MTATYRFGRFELQPPERRLLADGEPATVGSRAFDLLVVLVDRAGELVTKDELLQRVWPNVVVEENNLQVQISALRRILGAEAISTVAARGYCFTLNTERLEFASRPAGKTNLPRPLTTFIGHERDLTEYAQLLNQSRLLTLTGIGGCGKTRLAIKLAEMVLPSFPQGVWFVDLAPLSDADRVGLTVASSLGIREERDKPIVETLCRRLAGQRMLLILDNCEHVVAACAMLAERLLTAAADLAILATSRERLGIAGERPIAVRTMTLPPPETNYDARALESSEAVQLFVDRAHLMVPEFALDSTTIPAVVDICRRLDGIPLAIELAAALVQLLSVEQIRTRLDDRFRLLIAGSKVLSRHQTLRGVIEWSYAQLTLDDQQVFRRLAVFAGGWTLAAASSVAGTADDELAMIEMLRRLVDKSLVVVEREAVGGPRYRMMETVRHYAIERLDEGDEAGTTRKRFLTYYVALAKTAEPHLPLSTEAGRFQRLDPELENLLAAHGYCDSLPGGAEAGLSLASALRYFFADQTHLTLGRAVLEHALARRGVQQGTATFVRALEGAGRLAYAQGDYAKAKKHYAESLRFARSIGDRSAVAAALIHLGAIAAADGDLMQARSKGEEALAVAIECQDAFHEAAALNNLGELCREEGDWEQAAVHYRSALEIHHQQGLPRKETVISNLAIVSIQCGEHDRARKLIVELARHADTTGSAHYSWAALDATALLACAVGDVKRAARIFGAADALHAETGQVREIVDRQFMIPLLAQARKTLGDAAFDESYWTGHALSLKQALAEARGWLETPPDN